MVVTKDKVSSKFGELIKKDGYYELVLPDEFSYGYGRIRLQASPELEKLLAKKLPPSATNDDKSEDSSKALEGDCGNEEKKVGLDDFEVMKLVGKGAFGKVYQVRKVGSSEIYAMKVIRKDKVVEKNQARFVNSERDILSKLDHPFIVRLRYAFQTKYRLYLILDFINGGELRYQLNRQGLFREDLARIYAAEIVSAVSHLHEKGIMHRDLKPENILLGADGHVMLTDFGLAKQFDGKTKSNGKYGTLDYMAPEIVQGKYHDKTMDWWSIGIILFEMLSGKVPFYRGSPSNNEQQIINGKLKMPQYLTKEAHSLLKGLLQKDPSKRLGSGPNGSEDIKEHKWFKGINWKKLENREIEPSFVPRVKGDECVANFPGRLIDMPIEESQASSPKFRQNPFAGFTYVGPPF